MADDPEFVRAPAQQRGPSHVTLWAAALLLAPLGLCACEKQSPQPAAEPAPTETPDRLPEQERSEEAATAFGLSLPRGMRLTQRGGDAAYFTGRMELATVVEHLKPHLDAQRIEVNAGYTAFQNAKLKGDTSDKRLSVDVTAEGRGTLVVVRNVTRPAAPPGLTPAESWRRAGRNPDGTPLDENQLY
jgi:hypothetical protein